MIGIVGAGISGLALARELDALGVECVVLEADERTGGVIHSLRHDGRLLELGPQRSRLTAGMRELVAELRLEESVLTAAVDLPLYVYRAGALRRVPFSVRAFARTDLLSARGKLRMLREPTTEGLLPDETARDFFVRKFGEEAYANLIAPLYGGLYAGDPGRMPARFALRGALRELGGGRSLLMAMLRRRRALARPAPPLSFREGLQELTDALYRQRPERVVLGARVRRIARRGRHYVLLTSDSTANLECERVVITAPADAASALLTEVAPGAAERIATLHYNPLAIVHLHSDCDLRGLGYQVAFGEELATRGVTFNASMFGRDGVFTAYLGGVHNPGLVDMPDEWIGETAANEFRLVTGREASILRVGRTRIPAWDETWSAWDELELPDGIHFLANYQARMGLPGRLTEAERLASELARLGRGAWGVGRG